MNRIPVGWRVATLKDLAGPEGLMADGDWIESKDQDPSGSIRLIQLADIGDGVFLDRSSRFLTKEKAAELGCTLLKPGDLLIARMPDPLGRACIFPGLNQPSVTAVDVCIWRKGGQEADPRWLMYAINSPPMRDRIVSLASGTTRQRVSGGNLKRLELPTPPHSEQLRIVAKLDSLRGRSMTAREELARVSGLVERYKRITLKAAFSGRLTAGWRESHAGEDSGAELLRRIITARSGRANTQRERARLQRDLRENRQQLSSDELRSIGDIPAAWTACRIGSIGTVCNGSTPMRTAAAFWGGEIPWVSSGEVRNNLILETRERITAEGYENCSVRLLPKGTVLLAMIGEGKTRGQTSILGIEATINQNVAAIVIDHGLTSSEYLWWWLQLRYEETRTAGAGNGPKAMNCQTVRELPFVLPPLAEQEAIAQVIKAAFYGIDKAAGEAARAAGLLDRLEQATLAKAFRGELVPADAAPLPRKA